MKKIKLNKRDVVVLIVVACVIIGLFARFVVYEKIEEYKFAQAVETVYKKNENAIFAIDKIVLYSSANAIDNSEGKTLQDLNVYQYTDMAIYIDNTSYVRELTAENTVKEMYIDNIKVNSATSRGEKTLSYKNPVGFGKFKAAESNNENQEGQQDRIDFEIIYTNEDNEKSDYTNPTFYTDCSNPITLNYTNKNIVTGYAVSTQDTQITFDGSILRSVGVSLEDIACTIDFDIHIKNNLDQEFVCSVGVKVPLNSENRSIYNGYMYSMNNELQKVYTFFKK